jgi:hypothetical protein
VPPVNPRHFGPGQSIAAAISARTVPTETETAMLTCVIRYKIDPAKRAQFVEYSERWGQCIPRNGAQLIGYYAPEEGSATLAYGVYDIPSLAAYESYRASLREDPLGRQNFAFAQSEGFILEEDRTWLRRVSGP